MGNGQMSNFGRDEVCRQSLKSGFWSPSLGDKSPTLIDKVAGE